MSKAYKDNAEVMIEKYITHNQINFLIMDAYGHLYSPYLIISSTTAQMRRDSSISVLALVN